MYIKCLFFSLPQNNLTCLSALDDVVLWHKILGHASLSLLNKLVSKDLVIGLPSIKYNNDKVCTLVLGVNKSELLLH